MSNVVKQLAGGGSGQSLMDRVTAAKHSISGSGLAKVICKATTEEQLAPKKKHLYYLVECTNEGNISIPELANELLERLKHQNWVVVFKTLISIHHLMNYGNERFVQYLASNNCGFALVNFSDKSSVQGADMSRFICRYSAYIQEKAIAYRSLAFDFCKVKRGSEDAVLRTMSAEKLLKSLPALIAQFDSLLSFDARGNELSNAVISSAFALMYRDATRLFVAFNDGIINLLSKFFESMGKKQCRESLEIYKKFIVRSDRLTEFSKVAEYIGIERADVTRLEKHPASFLEAMESHLAHLEGRPRPAGAQGAAPVSASAPGVPRSASSGGSLGSSAAAPPKLSQLLAEEQHQLDRLKAEQKQRQQSTAATVAKPAPAPIPAPAPAPAPAPVPAPAPAPVSAPIDDFLLLGNGASAPVTQQQQRPSSSPFVANFPALNAAATQNRNGFDPFGSVLQPVSVGGATNTTYSNKSAPDNLNKAGPHGGSGGGFTGDLDSSLASLVGNLNMKQGGQYSAGGRQQGINWGVGGPAASANSSSAASSSAAFGAAASGRAAAGGGVKIAAGPTVNWGQQQQQQQPQVQHPASSSAYGMGFLHTQSQPAFRMSPQQQQMQQQQSGWYQPANQQNSGDPFGAL